MILSERVLQTPLHQLPYVVSQINSQIHKTAHDMTKYLEENVNVCMEQHNKKIQLRKQILLVNEQYKLLENVGAKLQIAISQQPPIEQKKEQIDYKEKLLIAIKNQNYDDMIKLFQLSKDPECAKIAINLLATRTKADKLKIKQLLNTLQELGLITDELIDIAVKVLLQKCFKMYFQQNVWNTNKNQITYYSDIIQLYQKSFNCTFKLLSVLNLPNYYQAHIANTIFQKFQSNVLQHLVTRFQREKSIQVLINFKDIQQQNLFYHLTNLYLQNSLIPQLTQDLQIKTLLFIIRNALVKNDSQLTLALTKKDLQLLQEWCKLNKQIQFNTQLYQALFNSEMQINFEQLI